MPIFNVSSAHTAAKLSWTRMVAMNAALLLAAISMSSNADAAVGCRAKTAHHAASTQCQAHHPRSGVHGKSLTDVSVKTTTVATIDSGEVALSGPTFSTDAAGVSPVAARTRPRVTAELPLDRGAVAAPGGRSYALGDLLHGNSSDSPTVPAPATWTILLAGLLSLGLLSRLPAVARARSWAMTSPSSASGRSGSRARAAGSAVDRVDPARYVQAQVRRSQQGHFQRGVARTAFAA